MDLSPVMESSWRLIMTSWSINLVHEGLISNYSNDLEQLTGHRPHVFLRRGMFFSHRCSGLMANLCIKSDTMAENLTKILDRYEQGKPFIFILEEAQAVIVCISDIWFHLFSPSTFFANLPVLALMKIHRWLQDVFQVPIVIQLTGLRARFPSIDHNDIIYNRRRREIFVQTRAQTRANDGFLKRKCTRYNCFVDLISKKLSSLVTMIIWAARFIKMFLAFLAR